MDVSGVQGETAGGEEKQNRNTFCVRVREEECGRDRQGVTSVCL